MAEALPVGAHMSGRVTHRVCAACSHNHERTEGFEPGALTWVAGCSCGCTANASEYDGTNVSVDDYRPDLAAAARERDHYAELCPTHHIPGPCAGSVDSHPTGTSGMDEGRDLRGGWVHWFLGAALPGFARDFGSQLVREWGRK